MVVLQVVMEAKPGADAGINVTFPARTGYLQYYGLNAVVLDNICVNFQSDTLEGSRAIAASLAPSKASAADPSAARIVALAALATITTAIFL